MAEKPGELQSMESHRVGHDRGTKLQQQKLGKKERTETMGIMESKTLVESMNWKSWWSLKVDKNIVQDRESWKEK